MTASILAADAGLHVWSITTDGTTVNMDMFKELDAISHHHIIQ